MVKIISLFNHKGGVSKTTTTFNLGWMLAEKGYRVLLVDADPQCNLTGVSLRLSGNEDFEEFYSVTNLDNIRSALLPVFENHPVALRAARCYEIPVRRNLFLLPGNIDFAEFDVSIGIAQELTGTLRLAQNIPGAINHLLMITAKEYKFDYILIDMGPSVSATNANILMQSDYFIVPCSPDYFCNMAISSLRRMLGEWDQIYQNLRVHPVFSGATYRLPCSKPKFIGTIQQKYRPRNGGPAKSFQQWIDRINNNVTDNLVPELEARGMIVDMDKFPNISSENEQHNICNISDFNSLIAQSQKYNVPIYALSDDQIEQAGQILINMREARNRFRDTFSELADNIIRLTT